MSFLFTPHSKGPGCSATFWLKRAFFGFLSVAFSTYFFLVHSQYWQNFLWLIDVSPKRSKDRLLKISIYKWVYYFKMSFELSDELVARELQRAKAREIGQPKVPGLDKTVKISDSLRFPDYHEPLGSDRWPFLADPLLEKIRKHGRHPPLLTDMGRTKGDGNNCHP